MKSPGVLSGMSGRCITGLIILSWALAPLALAQDQSNSVTQRSIDLIEEVGGSVIRDEIRPGRPVTRVELTKPDINDRTFRELRAFANLESLYVLDTKVTDAGMASLKGMSHLTSLCFSYSEGISDAGLPNLKGLANLRVLSLNGTNITSKGLANLKGLRRLQMLSLDSTQVTDDGLADLGGLTELVS